MLNLINTNVRSENRFPQSSDCLSVKMIATLIFLICLIKPFDSNAQTTSAGRWLALTAGAGNYESLHAGIHLSINQAQYIECAIGMSPWSFTDDYYLMQYICYGRRLTKISSAKLGTNVQAKLFHWNFRDEDITLSALGIGPEARLTYQLSSRAHLAANGGVIYNTAIHYVIKKYDDVEWLYRFGPSFSLQFIYWLK